MTGVRSQIGYVTCVRAAIDEDWAKRNILSGIPVLCALGSLAHFIYGLSGESLIAGIFTPVNESVWEHLKLAFWPVLLWWAASYMVFRRRVSITAGRWFTACAAAITICLVIITAFFYTYTGAFGIESLTLNIFSMVLGIAAAQGTALHIIRRSGAGPASSYVSIVVLIALSAAFIIFTFNTPQIPLFKDPSTGLFGLGN